LPDQQVLTVGTDETWQWTRSIPDGKGKFKTEPDDWQAAAIVTNAAVWNSVRPHLATIINAGGDAAGLRVRASLVKSDFLMRSLGRPNRDQIVTVRPDSLTTLEAIDLANGQSLANSLQRGSQKLMQRNWQSPDEFVRWLFHSTLCREPAPDELVTMKESLGEQLTAQGIEDAMWSILVLPEFQLVR
jgi:hypothetical protein